MAAVVKISKHTTASKPYPHVLYTVEVYVNGTYSVIERRYSEFLELHEKLQDPFALPPKRLFALLSHFLPLTSSKGWLDDALIEERKKGLTTYLSAILWSKAYADREEVKQFLQRGSDDKGVESEDALPSEVRRGLRARLLGSAAGGRDTMFGLSVRDSVFGTFRNLTLGGIKEDGPVTFDGPIAAAYYPEWSAKDMPPEVIDYSKFDVLFFGFATPNSAAALDWSSDAQSILKRIIRSIKLSKSKTKVVLSIGGWNGSQWFSDILSKASTMIAFIQKIIEILKAFNLDGVDIDWEFPNNQGSGNPSSPEDAANLLSFVQSLRSAVGPSKIISVVAGHAPWTGEDGKPLDDVSDFAEYVTFINVMNYGIWGASSTPAANSPLGMLPVETSNMQASAEAALVQWTEAGFPASKMLLGLPLYGYVFKSSKSALDSNAVLVSSPSSGSRFTSADSIHTNNATMDEHPFSFGAHREPSSSSLNAFVNAKADQGISLGAWHGKAIPFKALVKSGALVKRFDGGYGQPEGDAARAGYVLGWDDASSTPYLFNTEKRTLVTFDNARSMAAKANYARVNGMAGCFTWSLDQDDNYSLHDIVRAALGK
ncbi:hypothetical protein CVT24_004540 [Panaeolus cyanescens]|uniref:Uncharacterized protein n=1 Tax=Panaeolus cyanescens TaxID=181874 RepID=A0A409W1E4_9AGAR|nr:hypothetical protein CVT24_004540 [Panaeolus cyanescens]